MSLDQIKEASNLIVRVPMAALESGSWDFRPDFYQDKNNMDFERGTKEFKKWAAACDVDIHIRNGETLYVIVEANGSEWGSQDTGDDAATMQDVANLIKNGQAEILNYEN